MSLIADFYANYWLWTITEFILRWIQMPQVLYMRLAIKNVYVDINLNFDTKDRTLFFFNELISTRLILTQLYWFVNMSFKLNFSKWVKNVYAGIPVQNLWLTLPIFFHLSYVGRQSADIFRSDHDNLMVNLNGNCIWSVM